MPFNLPFKTLGGMQFWTDVRLFPPGFRIQRHLYFGHHRLLDDDDYRLAWGSLQECTEALDRIVADRGLSGPQGEGVILVHGVCRSSHSMRKLQLRLRAEGFSAYRWDYASTRRKIERFVPDLASCVAGLADHTRLHFVTHSMGGLVVRKLLADGVPENIGRVVMLGPPNQGSPLADLFRRNPLFWLIYGPAGQQLRAAPESFVHTLPPLPVPVGIIAAMRGKEQGFNPLFSGDDDTLVPVDNTHLPEESDWRSVRGVHTVMMNNPSAVDLVVRFLKTGTFEER
jgi:pimeloyl-ACP methyl ester carboxylesterase